MAFSRNRNWAAAWILLASASWLTVPLSAQEFRIETDVYVNKSLKPTSQNVTLFSDAMVFDFQLSGAKGSTASEITIYDRQNRSFVLMDMERRVRLRLDVSDMLQIVESVRSETLQNKAARFLAEINFDVSVDQTTQWVSAKNEQMEYQFTGRHPDDATILTVYHDFLDHYTMLSATDPRRLPPFARLRFNRVIKKYGWLPSEIKLSVKPNELFRESFTARTNHTFNSSLSRKDNDRIRMAKSASTSFKDVSLAQYRGLSAAEASSKKTKSR